MQTAVATQAVSVQSVPRRTETSAFALAATVLALLSAAVMLRIWRLGELPGINGDEAWYGVLAQRLLSGESIPSRTPTGNVINVFYFLPQLVLHAVFPASFTLLRVVAVVSGLLALPVNFFFARTTLGKHAAWLSTCALAVLPITIAYSRFGWDASQSVLACVVVVHASLLSITERHAARWAIVAIFSLLAAVIVHPTNVFIAPVLGCAVVFRWWPALASVAGRRTAGSKHWALLALTTLIVAAATYSAALRWPDVLYRLTHPAELASFLQGCVSLFSGVTVYQFVPGSLLTQDAAMRVIAGAHGLVFLAVCGWGVLSASRCTERDRTALRVLLPGLLLGLAAFYLIAGPRGLAPHFERYALWMVAPVVLSLSVPLAAAARNSGVGAWTMCVIGCLALLSFATLYIRHLDRTGGTSHVAFRTSAIEPKQAVRDLVASRAGQGGSVRLLTHSWWAYWPLQYLAHEEPQIHVVQVRSDDLSSSLRASLGNDGKLFVVEFLGSTEHRQLLRQIEQLRLIHRESWVYDSDGESVLSVIEVILPADQ